ncbi:MAG: hypothetical protein WCA78_01410 [Rhizomicrobium sp.]
MKWRGASPERSRGQEEPREIRRLKLSIEHGSQVMRGKLIYGSHIRDDLIEYLADAREKGIDLSKSEDRVPQLEWGGTLEDQALGLIDGLLQAEAGNCQQMAAKCRAKGDSVNAELWDAEARKSLASYRKTVVAEYRKEIAERQQKGDIEGAARRQKELDRLIAGWGQGGAPNGLTE